MEVMARLSRIRSRSSAVHILISCAALVLLGSAFSPASARSKPGVRRTIQLFDGEMPSKKVRVLIKIARPLLSPMGAGGLNGFTVSTLLATSDGEGVKKWMAATEHIGQFNSYCLLPGHHRLEINHSADAFGVEESNYSSGGLSVHMAFGTRYHHESTRPIAIEFDAPAGAELQLVTTVGKRTCVVEIRQGKKVLARAAAPDLKAQETRMNNY